MATIENRLILLAAAGAAVLLSPHGAAATSDDPEQLTHAAADLNRLRGIFPDRVKTVAVIAPASPASTAELDLALAMLKQTGVRVKVMPYARERENSGYISIEPEKRVADLEQAWLDPEVDLILCVRGGVGSEELVDRIDWQKLRRRDMPLVGFSNITALHLAMLKTGAGHPFSGPSLTALPGCDDASLKQFRQVLDGAPVEPQPLRILRPGKCSGLATGGLLMLLEKMSRTAFAPDNRGKVIFIECPGQTPAVLRDRLEKLHERGFFRDCAGVVFCHFTRCGDPAAVEELLQSFAATLGCPVFAGYPYGHESSNRMLDFKRRVTVDEKGALTFE